MGGAQNGERRPMRVNLEARAAAAEQRPRERFAQAHIRADTAAHGEHLAAGFGQRAQRLHAQALDNRLLHAARQRIGFYVFR